jgi:hypothetical protein
MAEKVVAADVVWPAIASITPTHRMSGRDEEIRTAGREKLATACDPRRAEANEQAIASALCPGVH